MKNEKTKAKKTTTTQKKHLKKKKTKFPWRDRAIQIANNKVMNKNM